MAAVNPSEPAHPSQNQAYETQGNPASKEPAEQAQSNANAKDDSDAVKGDKEGGGGSEPGLETDLDRKKAEQAPMREEMQEKQKKDVDVQGVLGQRGGPATPVSWIDLE